MRLSPCVLVQPDGWARGEREGYGGPCDVTSLSLNHTGGGSVENESVVDAYGRDRRREARREAAPVRESTSETGAPAENRTATPSSRRRVDGVQVIVRPWAEMRRDI